MSEVKHTPGLTVELSASTGLGYASVRELSDDDMVRMDRVVADVYGTGTNPTDSDSLATLFAAAPALLEALRDAAKWLDRAADMLDEAADGYGGEADKFRADADAARAAIARAEKGGE